MYYCKLCNTILDISHLLSSKHCDTLEHRDKLSRMIPGKEDTLPALLIPGSNTDWTDKEWMDFLANLPSPTYPVQIGEGGAIEVQTGYRPQVLNFPSRQEFERTVRTFIAENVDPTPSWTTPNW